MEKNSFYCKYVLFDETTSENSFQMLFKFNYMIRNTGYPRKIRTTSKIYWKRNNRVTAKLIRTLDRITQKVFFLHYVSDHRWRYMSRKGILKHFSYFNGGSRKESSMCCVIYRNKIRYANKHLLFIGLLRNVSRIRSTLSSLVLGRPYPFLCSTLPVVINLWYHSRMLDRDGGNSPYVVR